MLHKIVQEKENEVRHLYRTADVKAWEREIAALPPSRPFANHLAQALSKPAVIAEIKKASPSKGVIRPQFDPQKLAVLYENAGAQAISVLTDQLFFQGSPQHLRNVKGVCNLPLLRKDFIIDPIQVLQSRLLGADCILLIAAILDDHRLTELSGLAGELGMDVLMEVHDQGELERVLSLFIPALLGINNRNLKTFETDLSVTEKLLNHVPVKMRNQIAVVSESGISTPQDIARLSELGVDAVLVGEYFMRNADVAEAMNRLLYAVKAKGLL